MSTLFFLVLTSALSIAKNVQTTKMCYEVVNSQELDCCNKESMFNPCSAVLCLTNTECVLHHTPTNPPNCKNDYFPFKPKCLEPCKTLRCTSNCIPFLNNNRCTDCKCDKDCGNPCVKSNPCGDNEECYLEQVICKKEPCCPQQKCRPKCKPQKTCPENCLLYIDAYGCKKCHCCNACVNNPCPRGTKCVLNPVKCITCPCPIVAECKSKFE